MSDITNCILSFSFVEDTAHFESEMVKYFESTDRPKERFVAFDRSTLPSYTLEVCVYLGVFNYLCISSLCGFLSKYDWARREHVQLFVQVQEDVIFREVRFPTNGYSTADSDLLFMKG